MRVPQYYANEVYMVLAETWGGDGLPLEGREGPKNASLNCRGLEGPRDFPRAIGPLLGVDVLLLDCHERRAS